MTTFFIPQTYPTIDALKNASYFDAVSDSVMNSVDVFGYVDGVAYAAVYEDDQDGDVDFYVTAGDPIPQHNDLIELAVCTDCIMLIANGELPPDSDETTDSLLEDGCVGVMYGGEDLGFSYRACDCCRRPLGGDRFRAYKKGE